LFRIDYVSFLKKTKNEDGDFHYGHTSGLDCLIIAKFDGVVKRLEYEVFYLTILQMII